MLGEMVFRRVSDSPQPGTFDGPELRSPRSATDVSRPSGSGLQLAREGFAQSLLPSSAKPDRGIGGEMLEQVCQVEVSAQEEDLELVRRAQSGVTQAFDALVERHTAKLYGLVFNMTSNHEDTNDLLQEVWTKVFRSLAGFRGASRFTTWVHSIAVNMTINFLKRRNRRQALSLDAEAGEGELGHAADAVLVSTQTPRLEASRSELQTRLNEALARLTPDHRAVVTMFDIQGIPHAEIARVLGVSEGTVRSRLFYAHRQLQSYLSDFHSQKSGT